jgi:hypothetical protein
MQVNLAMLCEMEVRHKQLAALSKRSLSGAQGEQNYWAAGGLQDTEVNG